jgi:hypothetical protein
VHQQLGSLRLDVAQVLPDNVSWPGYLFLGIGLDHCRCQWLVEFCHFEVEPFGNQEMLQLLVRLVRQLLFCEMKRNIIINTCDVLTSRR